VPNTRTVKAAVTDFLRIDIWVLLAGGIDHSTLTSVGRGEREKGSAKIKMISG
jgi:hypothetical protein